MATGTRPSKAQQQTTVGEGLAVGCLALGVVGVTTEKMAVEFAFRKAWRRWAYADRFPVINAGPSRDDIIHVIDNSAGRRSPYVAAWEAALPSRVYEPYLRHEMWSVEETGEFVAEHSGVPFAAWRELAWTFVEDLGEGKVWYAEDE